MRKILSVALAGALGLAMIAPVAVAKEAPPEIPALTEILADPQAVQRVIPALPDSITKVDPTLVRVFLYNERKREETEPLSEVVENRLGEELLRLHRFKVLEAREAKTTRVESTASTFQVSNTIESLARLRAIGQAIGADAVLMYAAQIQDRMVLVNMRLVRVTDGEIVWTERFAYNFDLERARREAEAQAEAAAKAAAEKKRLEEEKRTRDNGVYAYTGVTGFSMRRVKTAGAASDQTDAVSQAGVCAGLTLWRNFSFLDNAAFGGDLEVDQAGSVNPNLSMLVASFTPMVLLRLDPLFVKGDNNGIFNLYMGAGETWMFEDPLNYQFTGKAGLMMRPMPDMFVNLGAVYMPAQALNLSSVSGLSNTVDNYGGLTYQVTVGMAFK